MKKAENLRSNNLRFSSALPYLKWLLKAIEDKDATQIKNAVINGKAYIKENKL